MGLGLDLLAARPGLATSNLPALLTCFVVTALCCAILHRLLQAKPLLPDRPGPGASRVQRVGGVAALIGMSAGAWLLTLSGQAVPWLGLTAGGLLAIMGFMDDLQPQDPLLALTYQATVGAGLGWAFGPAVGWLFVGAAIAPLVITTTRLMDGINAMSTAIVLVWGAVAAWVGIAAREPSLALLGLLAAAAAAGFAPWNTHGVRLFLGDSGRYLFGGVFSTGVISAFAHDWRAGVLVLMPLMVPFVDVASTWALERSHHRPTSKPHRERIYQRLVDELGLSHPHVTWIVSGFSLAVVLLWFFAPWFLALPATILLLALYVDLPRLIQQHRRPTIPPAASATASGSTARGATPRAESSGGATAVPRP